MDNFDLKKYLIENRISKNSKLSTHTFTYVLLNKGEKVVDIEASNMDEAGDKVVMMYPKSDPMLTHIDGKKINYKRHWFEENTTNVTNINESSWDYEDKDLRIMMKDLVDYVKSTIGKIPQDIKSEKIVNDFITNQRNDWYSK